MLLFLLFFLSWRYLVGSKILCGLTGPILTQLTVIRIPWTPEASATLAYCLQRALCWFLLLDFCHECCLPPRYFNAWAVKTFSWQAAKQSKYMIQFPRREKKSSHLLLLFVSWIWRIYLFFNQCIFYNLWRRWYPFIMLH